VRAAISFGFYALGIGLSFATITTCVRLSASVSMPSVSGWALRLIGSFEQAMFNIGFYALGIGLGFAT
jgi:hypothetical protein